MKELQLVATGASTASRGVALGVQTGTNGDVFPRSRTWISTVAGTAGTRNLATTDPAGVFGLDTKDVAMAICDGTEHDLSLRSALGEDFSSKETSTLSKL